MNSYNNITLDYNYKQVNVTVTFQPYLNIIKIIKISKLDNN